MIKSAVIQWIVSFCFISLIVYFWVSIIRSERSRTPQSSKPKKIMCFLPYFICLIIGMYQTRWQIFGFLSPEFLRVQRGFDSRGDLIGNRFQRGSILDAKGLILAEDAWDEHGLNRYYPLGSAGLHPIGYHHPIFGSSGLEKSLDARLMGRRIQNAKDILRLLLNGLIHRQLHGNPVQLTLYSELQVAAASLLRDKIGAIVVLDPASGSILAMASSPSFNANNMDSKRFETLRSNKESPFLNRAVNGLYPPGSTFKTLVSTRALELNIRKKYRCDSNGFNCGPGEPPVNDYKYYILKNRNQVYKGHGVLSLEEALAESCNVYFAQLGQDLGGENIIRAALNSGMNQTIPNAGPGLESHAGFVPIGGGYYTARLARLAIGQDKLLATPLHLALIAAALGSNGTIPKPRYLKDAKPEPWLQLTSPRVATDVARQMIQAVETGTGKAARIPGIIVGGKTGTAENASGKSHALFIGFAPWPEPKIALTVVIEQAGTGGSIAAPIGASILKTADDLNLLTDPLGKVK